VGVPSLTLRPGPDRRRVAQSSEGEPCGAYCTTPTLRNPTPNPRFGILVSANRNGHTRMPGTVPTSRGFDQQLAQSNSGDGADTSRSGAEETETFAQSKRTMEPGVRGSYTTYPHPESYPDMSERSTLMDWAETMSQNHPSAPPPPALPALLLRREDRRSRTKGDGASADGPHGRTNGYVPWDVRMRRWQLWLDTHPEPFLVAMTGTFASSYAALLLVFFGVDGLWRWATQR
jgi:hypothetical protein